MSGWSSVKDGNVRLDHLSTSSLVVMTMVEYPDGYDQAPVVHEKYFDYSEFDSLCRCIEQIMPSIVGPQDPIDRETIDVSIHDITVLQERIDFYYKYYPSMVDEIEKLKNRQRRVITGLIERKHDNT